MKLARDRALRVPLPISSIRGKTLAQHFQKGYLLVAHKKIEESVDWMELRALMVPIRSLVMLHETIDFYILPLPRATKKKRLSWTSRVSASVQEYPMTTLSLTLKIKQFLLQKFLLMNQIAASYDQDKPEHAICHEIFTLLQSCTNMNAEAVWEYRQQEEQKTRIKSVALMLSHPDSGHQNGPNGPAPATALPVPRSSSLADPPLDPVESSSAPALSQLVTQVSDDPLHPQLSNLDYETLVKTRKPFGKCWWEHCLLHLLESEDGSLKECAASQAGQSLKVWMRRSWTVEYTSM